ncbi:MAG: DUF4214 domain-containing protein [Clostridia bacterium]|nr:DUF4214 domain-containing protein [Clostridia bacterium]
MKFKRLMASFLMGATLVSGISVPVVMADTNTYASTFDGMNYAAASVNMDGIKAFVTRMYRVCLDREPEEEGLNGWAQKLAQKEATGCSVAYGFVFSPEFIGKNPTNEAFVNYMYDAFFGREADEGGFKYWVDLLNNGASKESIFCGFANSEEFSNLCNNYGVVRGFHIEGEDFNRIALINLFVERLYNVVLDRTCDEVGMPGWTVKLNSHEESGCSVAYGFVFSPEFLNKHTCNDCYVEILYNAFLGRSSDTSGKSSWVSMLNEGKSRELVFNGFAGSLEFAGICSEYGIEPGSLSTEGTTHAEGTCTICGNQNSGSSNNGSTNNGGTSSGSGSSNNGSSNGGATSGNGGSSGTNGSGATNNGGSSTGSGNSNNGSTPTSTPTPYPTLTPPSKYKEFLEPGLNIIDDYDEYKKDSDNGLYGYYLNEEGYLVTGWVNVDKEDTFKIIGIEDNEVFDSDRLDVFRLLLRDTEDRKATMYFDPATGSMLHGLSEIDGVTYLFDGFVLVTGSNQSIRYSERYLDDYCYYFVDEKGIVQTSGWQTNDMGCKYYVDSFTYKLVTGWQEIDGNKYYFNYLCEMETGFRKIDSKYYFFNADGVLQTEPGWKTIDSKKYYFLADGVAATGWNKLDNKWYYFNEDSTMRTNDFAEDNGQKYYLGDDGVMVTDNWVEYEDKWYHLSSSGAMEESKWIEYKDKWYYVDESGVMLSEEWLTYQGSKYYFNKDGSMHTGWLEASWNKYYYFDTSGKMKSSCFITYNGGKYYLGDDGIMYSGKWLNLDGNWYYFASGGKMVTGVYYYDGRPYNCYFFDSNGIMQRNCWRKNSEGDYFYLSDSGKAYHAGFYKIDGKWYSFNLGGKLIVNEETYKGYWAGPDGVIEGSENWTEAPS